MERLIRLAEALETSSFGIWARESPWAYPTANLVHLLGLILLVGGIGVVDLRLAGLFRAIPLQPLSRALLPVALLGLALLAASGPVMFAADAHALADSEVFRWKLTLIALALVNAVAFRLHWSGTLAYGDRISPIGRAMAVTSIALWLSVAALGRMIAYS